MAEKDASQDRMPEPVTVDVGGTTYSGTYTVRGVGTTAIVTVHSDRGAKATQVGGLPPRSVAEQLLSELARKGRPLKP